MKMIAALALVVMMAATGYGSEYINISKATNAIHFYEQGTLVPQVQIHHLILDIDLEHVLTATEQLVNVTAQASFIEADEGGAKGDRWSKRFLKLRRELERDAESLRGSDERIKKDVIGWGAAAVSLYNTYEIFKLSAEESHIKKGVQSNLKMIETIGAHINATDSAIHKTANKVNALIDIGAHTKALVTVEEGWTEIRSVTTAIRNVMNSAVNHKLHPDIETLADTWSAWEELNKNAGSRVPVFPNPRHIFQLPMSIGSRGSSLRVVVHVPMKKNNEQGWTLHKWSKVPWLSANHIQWLQDDASALLLHPDMNKIAEIPIGELEKIPKVGNVYAWPAGLVELSGTGFTCLSTLWFGNHEGTEQFCLTRRQDIVPMAWNHHHGFITITPPNTTAILNCAGGISEEIPMNGLQEVRIKEDCFLVLHEFELHPGPASTNTRTIVRTSPSILVETAENNLAKLAIHLPPTNIQQAVVAARLQERQWPWLYSSSGGALLAIIVGSLVIMLLACLWCRAGRMERAAAKNAH